jgi:hypothetical protein
MMMIENQENNMNKDQLIVRLSRELYDLKQKIEDIRALAEKAEESIRSEDGHSWNTLSPIIDIINLVDSGEIYEN